MLHAKNQPLEWATHYEALSVDEDASYEEMRENYKIAILSSHPDKTCSKSGKSCSFEEQKERFLRIRNAWEILSDPKSRENYDKLLRASRNQVELVECEIILEEMMAQVDGDVRELLYPCRCGDYFSITSMDTVDPEGSGRRASVVLPCDSCSLKIRVIINGHSDLDA